MLVLSRKTEQILYLGEDIQIKILEIQGKTVRLGIDAPKSLRILRKEIKINKKKSEP
jgi:carbon storage regulator